MALLRWTCTFPRPKLVNPVELGQTISMPINDALTVVNLEPWAPVDIARKLYGSVQEELSGSCPNPQSKFHGNPTPTLKDLRAQADEMNSVPESDRDPAWDYGNAIVAIEDLADDLLDGVEAISRFTGLPPRRIYYLAERRLLPVFKLGDRKWQARKSTIRRHLDGLEAKRAESWARIANEKN